MKEIKTINIIGDIAGRYDEFLALIAKMPQADLTIGLGDLMDRGPKSREVIQWFKDNQDKALALYGNHEDMMVDALVNGRRRDWFYNGGYQTLNSYKSSDGDDDVITEVPNEHVEFLQSLPMYWTNDEVFISHAPITSMMEVPKDPYSRNQNRFIWNRNEPRKAMDKFVINGHNGRFQMYVGEMGEDIGMCIDDSHAGKLFGVHWPSRDLYSVDNKPQGEET